MSQSVFFVLNIRCHGAPPCPSFNHSYPSVFQRRKAIFTTTFLRLLNVYIYLNSPTFHEERGLMATAIALEHAPAPRSPTSIERDPTNIVWSSLFIVFIFFEFVKYIFRATQWLWMAFDLRGEPINIACIFPSACLSVCLSVFNEPPNSIFTCGSVFRHANLMGCVQSLSRKYGSAR